MLQRHQNLISTYGHDDGPVWDSETMIHDELRAFHERVAFASFMQLKGWPIAISFKDLPARIMTLRPALHELLTMGGTDPVYGGLRQAMTDLGMDDDLTQLAGLECIPAEMLLRSRPG
jgi:hypothetical protein